MAEFIHLRTPQDCDDIKNSLNAIEADGAMFGQGRKAIVILADDKNYIFKWLTKAQSRNSGILCKDAAYVCTGSYKKISGCRTKFKDPLKAIDQGMGFGSSAKETGNARADNVSGAVQTVVGAIGDPWSFLIEKVITHAVTSKQYFLMVTCARKPQEFSKVQDQKLLILDTIAPGQLARWYSLRTLYATKILKQRANDIREKKPMVPMIRIFTSARYKRQMNH
ncbi:MAG: hypothetical protein ACI841_003101 [Planctomycetota bacterium]|jgi:hypothetical protein